MENPPTPGDEPDSAQGPHPWKHLTAWRETAGLTQEQVANIFQVSNVTIHRWEAGKAPMTVANFISLAGLYGAADPGQLMFPPASKDAAVRLRRAYEVLSHLPDQQASHWLESGESLSRAFDTASPPSQRKK